MDLDGSAAAMDRQPPKIQEGNFALVI